MIIVYVGRALAALAFIAAVVYVVEVGNQEGWDWRPVLFTISYPLTLAVIILVLTEILAELKRRR